MEIKKNGFKNEKLGLELDVYVLDGKEWFRALDIAKYLEYRDSERFTRLITFKQNISTHNVGSGKIKHNETFVNEYGLYEVLCKITRTSQERYNKAREFQQWVFEEVLPSIRKTGTYVDSTATKEQLDRALAEIQMLHSKHEIIKKFEKGEYSLGAVSKTIFNGSMATLKKVLIRDGYMTKDNRVIIQYCEDAEGKQIPILLQKVSDLNTDDGIKTVHSVKVTGLGRYYFMNLYGN